MIPSLNAKASNFRATAERKKRASVAGAEGAPRSHGSSSKRKEQNRVAQRAFRKRQKEHYNSLDTQILEMGKKMKGFAKTNSDLVVAMKRLQRENIVLKSAVAGNNIGPDHTPRVDTPLEGAADVDMLVSIHELTPNGTPHGLLVEPGTSQLQLSMEQSTWSDDSSSVASSIDQSPPIPATESLVNASPWIVSHSWTGDASTMQQHNMQPSVPYENFNDPRPMLVNHHVQKDHNNSRMLKQHSVEPHRRATWDSSQYLNLVTAVGDMPHQNNRTSWALDTQMNHQASFQADGAQTKSQGWRNQGLQFAIPAEIDSYVVNQNRGFGEPSFTSHTPVPQAQTVAPQILNPVPQRGVSAMNTLVGPTAGNVLSYSDTLGGMTQMYEQGSGGRTDELNSLGVQLFGAGFEPLNCEPSSYIE